MRPGARAIALLVLGMAIHLAALVLAEAPRVVLVGPSPQHPLVTRMRDELQVLGMDVEIETPVPPGDAGSDLAAVGRRRGAAAVARIQASPPEIFLWVDPARVGGDGLRAELRVSESVQGPASPGLLPLRAVELLRGMLIPVPQAAQPARAPSPGDADLDAGRMDSAVAVVVPVASSSAPALTPAPLPSSKPVPQASHLDLGSRLSLHVAAAVLLSPGGVPAAPQARIGAGFRPLSRFGVEAMVYIPTTVSTVSSINGAVNLRVLDFGADFRGLLTEPGADLSVTAGLGLGAMALFFDGDATAPYVASHGSRWVAAPYSALGASYRFLPRLALRADILAALARPEPVVRVVDRDAATFGQPAVFLSLGVEVRP